jgi:biopolymer transport protein ExbD/biopolymer transport protein TolR
MGFRRRQAEPPRVDLTPMVDVVFLLLIFFMISTTFIEKPGLTINLPKSSSQMLKKDPQEVRVYLRADGTLFLEKEQLDLDGFRQKLDTYGDKAGETTFLLMADKDVKHGEVVQVMDLAKNAGFLKLAIATEKQK